MTDSTAAATPQPAQPGFFDDFIEIFYKPADVFRRRQNGSIWAPMLLVAISIGVIFFFTFNALQPMMDAEFTRATAAAIKKNPQLTQEAMDKMRGVQETIGRYAVGIVMLVTMWVLGTFAWLVGKLVGAKQTYHAALVVAAWSYVPRIVGALLAGIQGLVMDPSQMTGQLALSLSPARFLDPDTANPLVMQMLGRLDLITIWVTVLLSIGLYATGRVSKGKAVVFGILIFVIGSLPALRQGYVAM
ncbi:MAG TPA: Yip1 family protein [Gemmatimonadaceae bacterium]|nr:Yip1 family protein [Gemmatimonadaceae bacterium]